MADSGSKTVDKALTLLTQLLGDGGGRSLAQAARAAGLPLSTSYRILATLQNRGFIVRVGRGPYRAGAALLRLGRAWDVADLLRELGRPVLTRLARETGLTAHLGVFENDMVTYLVKAPGKREVLTREGMQLEAYCSGIGKVLLAALPQDEADRYLAAGPFVRLTPRTIVEPWSLRAVIDAARADNFAMDDREIDESLRCIAVPVRGDNGQVCAAISLSAPSQDGAQAAPVESHLARLRDAARQIEDGLAYRIHSPKRGRSDPEDEA